MPEFPFYNFTKKKLWHMCFSVNFAKFLRTPFFIERIWWLRLVLYLLNKILMVEIILSMFFMINFHAPYHFLKFFTVEMLNICRSSLQGVFC